MTSGDVLEFHVRETEWVAGGGCTPVPESTIVADGFAALLVNATLPVTAAAAAGVKVAVNAIFCPGFSITPLDAPVALNPAPETLTPENAIVAMPVFDKVNVCDTVVPM
jgi:hypothetical protein